MDTASGKGRTGFLTLPPELRNKIYALSLIRGTFCMYTYGERPWGTLLNCYTSLHIPLGILQANRQIHSEAIGFLYGENKFIFANLRTCYSDFLLWLEQIGPQNTRMLRQVCISGPGPEYYFDDQGKYVQKVSNDEQNAFIECGRHLSKAEAADLELRW